MRGLGILTAKPTGIEAGLIFGSGFSSGLEDGPLLLPVAEQRCMVEQPPHFLAENDPLRIVGVAAPQVPNPPMWPFSITRQFLMEKPASFKQL